MQELPKKLQEKLLKRKEDAAFRSLPIATDLVDFSSNDYLGWAKNKAIFKATSEFLEKRELWQNGATGSRLLSGNHRLYEEVEEKLTAFHKSEAALVFNSGYDANIGFFGAVPQRGDIIFYDEYIHASIRDGITMSHAKSYKFKHNDLADLKQQINRLVKKKEGGQAELVEAYVVTESVFSMDGDTPDLNAFAEFCTINGCRLIVDEAHAVGVYGSNGEGLLQELGLQDQVFARIVTFGKALGCHGAAILGSKSLKDYLVNFARSLIYTTAMSPHALAVILIAYQYLERLEGITAQKKLQENIEYFNQQLKALNLQEYFIDSNSAIHCCIVQGNERTRSIAAQLQESGFDVRPILSPTVPEGRERLRFCLHSGTTKKEMATVLQLVSTYL